MTTGFNGVYPTKRSKGRGKRALILLVAVVLGGIFFVLLNRTNPSYDQSERAALDGEIRAVNSTNELSGTRLKRLFKSPNTECHYRANPDPAFLLSGTLPDELIIPGSNAPRWYVIVPVNQTLFSPLSYRAGIVDMQTFYYSIVTQGGFKACDQNQAAKARNLLGLP